MDRRVSLVGLVLLVGSGAFLLGMMQGKGPPPQVRAESASVPEPESGCGGLRAEVDDLRRANDRARREHAAPAPGQCPPEAARTEGDLLRLEPASVLLRGAEAIPGLIDTWDEELFRRLFPAIDDVDGMKAQFAWFRERVGKCGAPTPISVEAATATRFAFACDGGVLEANLGTDDPQGESVTSFEGGIRDTPPPPEVAAAARRVVDMIENPDTASEGRMRDLMHRLHDGLGGCELQAVDLGGPVESLYSVECEDGIRRTLTVRIGDDGRIRGVKVLGLRRDPG